MPRYDERAGPTRLYVGHISSRTRTCDLEDIFSRYGRIREVDLKYDFAFVNFSDSRDADEARYYLNGRTVDGNRIVVEFAKKGPGGGGFPGNSRDSIGRGPPPGTGRCYNCGHDGHWARDCKAGDWKNRCYRCGQGGHIERNCTGSLRRHKRSPSRSPSARRHRSRSRSQSRSRSLSPRTEERSPARREQQHSPTSASRSRSRSPPEREVTSRSVSPAVNDQQSPVDDGLPQGNSDRSPSPSPAGDVDKSPIRENRSPSHSDRD